MNRYTLNILATQDLNEIAEYFANSNVDAGEEFFLEFNQRCKQLVDFPYSGKSYADLRLGLRGLSFKGYIIFYRVLEDGVEILRVLSGRRNLPQFFQESE
ncbi:type II toxin-antitoxin system RelE/ParE family toxin [Roseofilum sp. Guam]|uniref:type II toxin-antitoxin system RelE/ParE family toxin n=1 Tax=Roseofilum sp. Guam TaxID=2821502 RepID=UPI001B0E6D46|nr:type II toxin-antitoxin system RelE/ParE family toxin [Roseofilum sp. Guam]MBP0029899.1 type II toxin-antitoxin system RelE/ParE family toxin [Roseofilum sp. Guam]